MSYSRFKTVLTFNKLTLGDVAARVGCSSGYLQLQIRGYRRLTQAVRDAVRELCGAGAWPFILGESDTLTAPTVPPPPPPATSAEVSR